MSASGARGARGARGRVYLDHNATTPLRPEAREVLLEALERVHGNPSSVHASGRAARQLVDGARERVAAALGVAEDEVLFTSGGTEANNLALTGVLRPRARREGPGAAGLVTSAIEHASVLAPARRLADAGHPLTLVGVDERGRLDPDELVDRAARPGVGLVSLGLANNEVGSLAPIADLGRALRELPVRPVLHVDAVQALGRIPLELRAWGVDLASFSAHKVGGPVGVGVLVRRGGELEALAVGGEQEAGLRPGTEPAAAIAAAARAIELAVAERETLAPRLTELAGTLYSDLAAALPGLRLLGPAADDPDRLPGTLNLLLPGVDGKVLVTRLDLEGLEASAGSACSSGSLEPSHVLIAMGLDEEDARAGLRLSLGRITTLEDVRQAVDILRTTASAARATGVAGTGL